MQKTVQNALTMPTPLPASDLERSKDAPSHIGAKNQTVVVLGYLIFYILQF